MYKSPIQITIDNIPDNGILTENFTLDPVGKLGHSEDQLYTEAVFTDGKNKLDPILKDIGVIKTELDSAVRVHDDTYSEREKWKKNNGSEDRDHEPEITKFDPKKFFRSPSFRKLEDDIQQIFGFRTVLIYPKVEKYSGKTKLFESVTMDAGAYCMNRYPIEGIVTNSGFYDKSKSINLEIVISLGLIHKLTDAEIVAVILHEIGHNIDPALMDITYTETNVLSKYLTDRKGAITQQEKQIVTKHGINKMDVVSWLIIGASLLGQAVLIGIMSGIKYVVSKLIKKNEDERHQKMIEERLEKIRQQVKKDQEQFNRHNYSEAFADNFARMYGYGVELASAFRKMDKDFDSIRNNWVKLERDREKTIFEVVENSLKGVHKTTVHRYRALIKEYEADINDPNTPDGMRKALRQDKEELERLLKEYTESFDELQNRINQIINEELEIQESSAKDDDKSDTKSEEKKPEANPDEKKA